jgi:protein-S-isoprenylcysteine O-methyltransferase Ste14
VRNPIRLKNLRPRFVPVYLLGVALLFFAHPTVASLCFALPALMAGLCVRAWGVGHLVKTERLTVSGPYAFVRNPLYLGTLLVGLGFSVMLNGWIGWLSLLCVLLWFGLVYFPRKEMTESNRLRDRYGEVYQAYYEAVPAILPRRRAWRAEPSLADKIDQDLNWSFGRYDANNELGTFLACLLGVGLVALRVMAS